MAKAGFMVPFLNGNQLYYTHAKPCKANGFQNVFPRNQMYFATAWPEPYVDYGQDSNIIFKNNFVFEDTLEFCNLRIEQKAYIVAQFISRQDHKVYYAINEHAEKILNQLKNGKVQGNFTFAPIGRLRYSLVLNDPVKIYKVLYDEDNRVVYQNYHEILAMRTYLDFLSKKKVKVHMIESTDEGN